MNKINIILIWILSQIT